MVNGLIGHPLIDHLQAIVDEMKAGKWKPVDVAVLVCRDAESGTKTVCSWAAQGPAREEVAELLKSSAFQYAQTIETPARIQ